MAHPVRLQVLEILRENGPLTATELGERIGESPANTSFHLRTLAKYGFVVEAERGKGRSRPWRDATGGLMIPDAELEGEARRAAVAMVQGMRMMLVRQIERWVAVRSGYPKKWQATGFEMEFRTRMTAEELKKVGEQIQDLLEPYKRPASEVPKGAKGVTVAAWGFPTEPPTGESSRRSTR
ncbi:helix-turn-helix domain-containing protein [Actinopolymorpha sp. NPDC004070]|uniref:helix-turn-helix domain-containing protein n=1 Tax=Actinopolymorpha sp. NPDC004070 TaxID=3154548 RepID=UPI0033A17B99